MDAIPLIVMSVISSVCQVLIPSNYVSRRGPVSEEAIWGTKAARLVLSQSDIITRLPIDLDA